MGLVDSPGFLSVLLVEVPLEGAASAAIAEPTVLAASVTVFDPLPPGGSLGNRVVTLWIGTDRTFVRERVSTSAVTVIPGRKFSFSSTRILTSNLVASCDWPPPP